MEEWEARSSSELAKEYFQLNRAVVEQHEGPGERFLESSQRTLSKENVLDS